MHNAIPIVNHDIKKILLALEKQPQHGFEDCNRILSVNRDQALLTAIQRVQVEELDLKGRSHGLKS